MKVLLCLMLLTLGMANQTEYDFVESLQVTDNLLCLSSAWLVFYAPLHTTAYCILNWDTVGWKGCWEEIAYMLATSSAMWAVGCKLLS